VNGEFLSVIQAVTNFVTMLTIIFAFWQVRIAARQLRKQNDKSAIEFVLDAEGQFDGMHEALFGQDASVIRQCHSKEVDEKWSDIEVKKFVYYYRYYGHISRMVYLLMDNKLDVGMTHSERKEFLSPWIERLKIFRGDPIMQRIHESGQKYRNYNTHMLELSAQIFGTPDPV